MLNLDTHILIFAVTGKLRPAERRKLSQDTWSIAAIVLWELTKLHQQGRITFDMSDTKVRRLLSRIKIWPLDLQVCDALVRLDFSSDPADELIAATSLAHNLPLLTRDKQIRSSKIVPLA